MTIEERNKRVEENTDLVYKVLHSLNVGYDEDCFQQGCLALMRCIELFDESKGYKFSTYAYTFIRGSIMNYLKKDNVIRPITVRGKKVFAEVMSLDYEYSEGDVINTMGDFIGAEDVTSDNLIVDSYYSSCRKLGLFSLEEERLFRLGVEGYTNEEVANMYNIDKRKLQSIRKKVKKGLKSVICDEDLTYNVDERSDDLSTTRLKS